MTHQAVSPTTVVTLPFPPGAGRAVGFRSEVTGVGGPITTTFGIYSLTTFATRVGFVTETREGDSGFGWAAKINPLIRTGGGGGGGVDNYTLTNVTEEKTVPEGQTMLFEDDVLVDDGGELVVLGGVTAIRTEDNFSTLYVPQRSERVVQQNDEMLFTDNLRVDGQLTIDGQITDATAYDGHDILAALTAIAPVTPAVLGGISSTSFLTPAQARTAIDAPSFAQMNAAINNAGLQTDPAVRHGDFVAQTNTTHYVWSDDGDGKTVTLPLSPSDGQRVDLVGLGHGSDWATLSSTFPIYFIPSQVAAPFDSPTFALAGMYLSLVFRTIAATDSDGDAWYVTTGSFNAQFGNLGGALANAIVASDFDGKPVATPVAENALLCRIDSGPVSSIVIDAGCLPFCPINGVLGSFQPSDLVAWAPSTLVGPGTFVLERNSVNRYVASPGLILQMPSAPNDNDEVEIKECSAAAGTASDSVAVYTDSGFVSVENVGTGGNTQTDVLTEYKTWVKYKYDSAGTVWRIVGAAYQLP